MLDFSMALRALKNGDRVSREGWNGKGMWLAVQRPDAGSLMTLPYIYMRTAQGDLVPWLASQTDMLAEDWRIEAESRIADRTQELIGDVVATALDEIAETGVDPNSGQCRTAIRAGAIHVLTQARRVVPADLEARISVEMRRNGVN